MAVRVGWGIQGRATFCAGAQNSAPPLYQFLWLLSCLEQESNIYLVHKHLHRAVDRNFAEI